MSERQFARIQFDNPQNLSRYEILDKLGFKVGTRNYAHVNVRDNRIGRSFQFKIHPKLIAFFKQTTTPKGYEVNILNTNALDATDAKTTFCKEYGFSSLTFSGATSPRYFDVRAINLPLEQFESTLYRLENALMKIGLENITHIGRLCKPYQRMIPKEQLYE